MFPMKLLLFTLLTASNLPAQLQIGITETKTTQNKTLVTVKAKNTFNQCINNARIWVFAMDKDGKVVGQKATWLKSADDRELLLLTADPNTPEAEEEKTFNVVVDTQSEAVDTKITFSRIIMADGTLANVQRSVEDLPKE